MLKMRGQLQLPANCGQQLVSGKLLLGSAGGYKREKTLCPLRKNALLPRNASDFTSPVRGASDFLGGE
jgi:hypothetical protein